MPHLGQLPLRLVDALPKIVAPREQHHTLLQHPTQSSTLFQELQKLLQHHVEHGQWTFLVIQVSKLRFELCPTLGRHHSDSQLSKEKLQVQESRLHAVSCHVGMNTAVELDCMNA